MQHLDGFFKLRDQNDYHALPAQANQNVLHMLYRDWKSFFVALADYKAHPDKYEAIPHIPRYADKDGYKPLIFTNQTFVQIPFRTLIEMIKYKGEAVGIRVMVCEEAIQSKASSIDEDQIPVYGNDVTQSFTGKRIKRGLYRSKNGILMNTDINGASNIMRKVYPCISKRERLVEVL